MAQPYSRQDLKLGEQIVQQLHGLSGYEAWAECVAKAIAAERERCSACLEAHAELTTNSLHCGDNSAMIQSTHREAAALKRAADWLRGNQ